MVAGYLVHRNENGCSYSILVANPCRNEVQFVDRCSGLRLLMSQQERRMEAAEATQKSACIAGASQECSSHTANFQSEASLYQVFVQRYQACEQGSAGVANRARPITNGP